MVKRQAPKEGSSQQWGALEQAYSSLKIGLTFEFPEVHVTPHNKFRIEVLNRDTLEKDGRLANETREWHWVGVSLVKRMGSAYLTIPTNEGTGNWDLIVNDVLMLVLTASLGCRDGNILRGDKDEHEQPYIK